MGDLFQHNPEVISLSQGELWWFHQWLAPEVADVYYRQLERLTPWEQSTLTLAGKTLPIPRLNAWYGAGGYRYSGVYFEPRPFSRPLNALRAHMARTFAQHFAVPPLAANSALLNLYRDGRDSVAWHADDEPELGPRPQIASVSLGGSRRFTLKPRQGQERVSLELRHGDLLLMLGDLQRHWLHAVPKTRRPVGPRINVTFRDRLTD